MALMPGGWPLTMELGLHSPREILLLVGPEGGHILDFEYSDLWHPATDGAGRSLEIADALGERDSWKAAASWVQSVEPLGSPGVYALDLPPGEGGRQVSGDANQDGRLDISDAVALLGHLFAGRPAELGRRGSYEPRSTGFTVSGSRFLISRYPVFMP